MFPEEEAFIAKKSEEEFPGIVYPSPDERVNIRILSINKESMSMYAEIIDKTYQGNESPFAVLPISIPVIA